LTTTFTLIMLFKSLLLPLAVSAAVLDQQNVAAANMVVEKLEPRYRKTAFRNLYKLGPYTLNGAKSGGFSFFDTTMMGQSIFYTMPKTLCNRDGPCTILAAKVGVAFADGSDANPASGIYIHHILTSDNMKKQKPWLSNCGSTSRPALNIAGLLGGTAFVGTGEDSAEGHTLYTSEDGTRDSGYHVGAADSFTGWAQLVNYNKEAKQIYVVYDVEYVPGIHGDDIKTATFTATCGTSPMIRLSQSGPTNTTSGDFHFLESGKILGARGHLHDGGVAMDMFINNKYVCSSEAIYGTRGEAGSSMAGGHGHGGAAKGQKQETDASIKTIASMTACKGPIAVKKGDTMKLNAQYDLSKHPLRTSVGGGKAADVMGMLALSFAADKQ